MLALILNLNSGHASSYISYSLIYPDTIVQIDRG
jgi:hypothetical protein